MRPKDTGWMWLSPVCVVHNFPVLVWLQSGGSEEPGHKAQSPREGTSCLAHSPTSTEMKEGSYQLQLNIHTSLNLNNVKIFTCLYHSTEFFLPVQRAPFSVYCTVHTWKDNSCPFRQLLSTADAVDKSAP